MRLKIYWKEGKGFFGNMDSQDRKDWAKENNLTTDKYGNVNWTLTWNNDTLFIGNPEISNDTFIGDEFILNGFPRYYSEEEIPKDAKKVAIYEKSCQWMVWRDNDCDYLKREVYIVEASNE